LAIISETNSLNTVIKERPKINLNNTTLIRIVITKNPFNDNNNSIKITITIRVKEMAEVITITTTIITTETITKIIT